MPVVQSKIQQGNISLSLKTFSILVASFGNQNESQKHGSAVFDVIIILFEKAWH